MPNPVGPLKSVSAEPEMAGRCRNLGSWGDESL